MLERPPGGATMRLLAERTPSSTWVPGRGQESTKGRGKKKLRALYSRGGGQAAWGLAEGPPKAECSNWLLSHPRNNPESSSGLKVSAEAPLQADPCSESRVRCCAGTSMAESSSLLLHDAEGTEPALAPSSKGHRGSRAAMLRSCAQLVPGPLPATPAQRGQWPCALLAQPPRVLT